ncbi:hypothetical protein [Frankia sp. Cr2]|uniref:hypothetical protein n=1 Tax=Frankia sp. Cr2 TaxID=3073932 RepID=UPI002AD2358C|nr:hypothetical protein [Frankia sp. Cr2]
MTTTSDDHDRQMGRKCPKPQGELDLSLGISPTGGPLPITSTRLAALWDALSAAHDALGFAAATGDNEV